MSDPHQQQEEGNRYSSSPGTPLSSRHVSHSTAAALVRAASFSESSDVSEHLSARAARLPHESNGGILPQNLNPQSSSPPGISVTLAPTLRRVVRSVSSFSTSRAAGPTVLQQSASGGNSNNNNNSNSFQDTSLPSTPAGGRGKIRSTFSLGDGDDAPPSSPGGSLPPPPLILTSSAKAALLDRCIRYFNLNPKKGIVYLVRSRVWDARVDDSESNSAAGQQEPGGLPHPTPILTASPPPMMLRALSSHRFPSGGVSAESDARIDMNSPANARIVADFMFSTRGLSKAQMGMLLGDEGYPEILRAYVRLTKFSEYPPTIIGVEQCLRQFVSGFKLSGESQKIDRIIMNFAEGFARHLPADSSLDANIIHTIAVLCLALNVDLHNPNNASRRMTKAQFTHIFAEVMKKSLSNDTETTEEDASALYESVASCEMRHVQDREDASGNLFTQPDLSGFLDVRFLQAESTSSKKLKSSERAWNRVRSGKWKRRWFVLSSNTLFIFKNADDVDFVGFIPLENVRVTSGPDGQASLSGLDLNRMLTSPSASPDSTPLLARPLDSSPEIVNETRASTSLLLRTKSSSDMEKQNVSRWWHAWFCCFCSCCNRTEEATLPNQELPPKVRIPQGDLVSENSFKSVRTASDGTPLSRVSSAKGSRRWLSRSSHSSPASSHTSSASGRDLRAATGYILVMSPSIVNEVYGTPGIKSARVKKGEEIRHFAHRRIELRADTFKSREDWVQLLTHQGRENTLLASTRAMSPSSITLGQSPASTRARDNSTAESGVHMSWRSLARRFSSANKTATGESPQASQNRLPNGFNASKGEQSTYVSSHQLEEAPGSDDESHQDEKLEQSIVQT